MEIDVDVLGQRLSFVTDEGLFSPAHADRGTLAMLSVAGLEPGMKVLDLGCGWGLVGACAARICGAQNVVMTDIDPRAAALAAENARRNGVGDVRVYTGDALEAVPESGFDRILVNPPYQTDFAVAARMIRKGFNRLSLGGRLLLVAKRREWYKNRLIAIFGGVHIREIDGYTVFEAKRRARGYAKN